eukprot:5113946-Amphidinium_carterae.1
MACKYSACACQRKQLTNTKRAFAKSKKHQNSVMLFAEGRGVQHGAHKRTAMLYPESLRFVDPGS